MSTGNFSLLHEIHMGLGVSYNFLCLMLHIRTVYHLVCNEVLMNLMYELLFYFVV